MKTSKVISVMLIAVLLLIMNRADASGAQQSIDRHMSFSTASSKTISEVVPTLETSSDTIGTVTITYKKVTDADGYRLYQSDTETGNYKAVKTMKKESKTTFSISGLEQGRTYFYKIRAYNNVSGKTTWSKYSKVCAVTVLNSEMYDLRKYQDELADNINAQLLEVKDRFAEIDYVFDNKDNIYIRLMKGETIVHTGKYTGTKYTYLKAFYTYIQREGYTRPIDGIYWTAKDIEKAGISFAEQKKLLNKDDDYFNNLPEPWVYCLGIKYTNPFDKTDIVVWSIDGMRKYSAYNMDNLLNNYWELFFSVRNMAGSSGTPSKKATECLKSVDKYIEERFGTIDYYYLLNPLMYCYSMADTLVETLSPSMSDGSDYSGSLLDTAKQYLSEEEVLHKELLSLSTKIDLVKRDDLAAIGEYKKSADILLLKMKQLKIKTNRLFINNTSAETENVYQSILPGLSFSAYITPAVDSDRTTVIGYEITNNETEALSITTQDSYMLMQNADILNGRFKGTELSLVDENGFKLDSVTVAPGETKWIWFYLNGVTEDSCFYNAMLDAYRNKIVTFHMAMGGNDYFYCIDNTDIRNITQNLEVFRTNLVK